MLCGDFNVVRTVAEKWGSDRLNTYEVKFGECLNELEVTDLRSVGASNAQGSACINCIKS